MLCSLRARRRIELAGAILWVASAGLASAYDFSLNDVASELQLVQDLAADRFDHTQLSGEAAGTLTFSLNSPGFRDILESPLEKVCPTVSVANEYGRQYQFRSMHAGGHIDWMVTTPTDIGSQIEGIFPFLLPDPALASGGGAPAVLPFLPPGATVFPPGNLCLSPEDVGLLEQRATEACVKYPDLCPPINSDAQPQ